MNYKRIAVSGVVVPLVVILLFQYVIIPYFFGHWVGMRTGSLLGLIFIYYLGGLTVIVAGAKCIRDLILRMGQKKWNEAGKPSSTPRAGAQDIDCSDDSTANI